MLFRGAGHVQCGWWMVLGQQERGDCCHCTGRCCGEFPRRRLGFKAKEICRMYTPYFQLREEDKRIFPDYRSQNGMTNKHTRLQAVCVHCALSRKIPNRTFLRSLFDAQQIGIIAMQRQTDDQMNNRIRGWGGCITDDLLTPHSTSGDKTCNWIEHWP